MSYFRGIAYVLVLLLGLISPAAGWTQSASPSGLDPLQEPGRWAKFTAASGLPSNQVTDVVETTDGGLWAVTSAGLAWYDDFRGHPLFLAGGALWLFCIVSVLIGYLGKQRRQQTEETLQQYADRLEILRQIDQAILAAQSLEAIAEAALIHIRKLVPCFRASVTVFDREAHEARVIAVHAEGETRIGAGMRFSLDDIVALEPMWQGTINVVEDFRALSQPAPVVQALQAEGLRSCTSVPLMARGELIGALHLASGSPGAFSDDQINIAREVANLLAVALQQARLFEELHTAHERLQSLSSQLVEAQEAERRHLARELHDEIGPVLTAVRMSLQVAQQLPEAATRIPALERGISAVDRALEQIHTLSLDLRPALLDDLGLVPALRWYVDRQAQQAGFTACVAADAFEERLPPALEITCFRIVQEALTNVVRHAQAAQVQVELRNRETELELVVRDDGVGFDVEATLEQAAQGASLGLLSMQERARLVGGRFEITAAPERGAEIHARFPLSSPEKDDERRRGS